MLNKGQLAMAAAEAMVFLDQSERKAAAMFGVSIGYVQNAVELLRDEPDAEPQISWGGASPCLSAISARSLSSSAWKKRGMSVDTMLSEKAKRGRPSTRDEATTRRLLLHLRAAGHVGSSLEAVGVPRSTFYDWLKDDDFARRVKEARVEGRLRLAALVSAAATIDWRAAAWHLERSDPEHWAAS
jgi:hypothetical protein